MNHRLENGIDVDTGLGADLGRVLGRDADNLFNFVLHPLRISRRQVNLVDHGENLKIVVQREIGVGQRLRLDALGGIDDQKRALTGGERAADLVIEIHMPRRIDQVEGIILSILRPILQPDCAGLDRDAAFFLELHIIENLIFHYTRLHGAALFDQAV